MERSPRGFTLPEILVTLAITGVLFALLYPVLLTQQRSHVVQEQLADAQQSGRVIASELTRFLASLGAGVDAERGQMRLLVAHPHEVVFAADLRPEYPAMAAGAPVPGARVTDPYPTIPAGTYAPSNGAETYRFTLDRNNDNLVSELDRTQGEHYSLYREVNGGDLQEVAALVANPRVGEPLFRYWGDFSSHGTQSAVDQVDRTTSSRLAAGESLDAVVRMIEVNLITETAEPDPRYPQAGGYRQVRLRTAVAPENLSNNGR
jgi:prepilin-type N-terminal cleavage/methylation domain-containing protein